MDAMKRPFALHPRFPAEIYTADFSQVVAACSTKKYARLILTAVNNFDKMRETLTVLVDHASERYPHFESERGQRELEQARALLAKVKKG